MVAEEEFIKHFLKNSKNPKKPIVIMEEPQKQKAYHYKMPKKSVCGCGADMVLFGGYGWFCVEKLKHYLKKTNYRIIKRRV